MEKSKSYFSVNSLAPRGETVTVFAKKVIGSKSDGFAVVDNGKIFVIDIGKAEDFGLINFLISLRERWLGEKAVPSDKPARLELALIISHAHPDHMAALPLLLTDSRFCVTDVYAPERSRLSIDTPEALPSLSEHENRLENICEYLKQNGHTAKGITRIPFGKVFKLSAKSYASTLEIYPSHIDWSEDLRAQSEGLRYILSNNSATYRDRPQRGYTNGILNGNSLWVKIITGRHSVLITGDQRASDEMLGAMIRYYGENAFDCDVLKLTHHGEHNCPTYLIEAAKPQIAVFTTSREKADRKAVALCEKAGCENYYTGEGDLLLTLKTEGIEALGISLE